MTKVVVLLVTEKEAELLTQGLSSVAVVATPTNKNNLKKLAGKIKNAPRQVVG